VEVGKKSIVEQIQTMTIHDTTQPPTGSDENHCPPPATPIPPPIPNNNTTFNVILADYLIGAMDGFVPYQQDLILPQLFTLLAPRGRLYVVGLQPLPDAVSDSLSDPNHDTTTGTDTETDMSLLEKQNHRAAQNVICRVRQTRDACILLAGQRCYREYPMEWIVRQVEYYNNNHNHSSNQQQNNSNPTTTTSKTDDTTTTSSSKSPKAPPVAVRIVHSKQFPILYRHTTILKQINVGRSKIPYIPHHLRESMQQVWNDLEKESQQYTSAIPNGRVQLGFDYVVCIERTE
jgi:hypothetical protein